jgi:hypothetical protein
MKHVALTDFLTEAEIERAWTIWREQLVAHPEHGASAAAIIDREIITPNLARINAALGQENDARYMAYAIEFVFTETAKAMKREET